MKRENLEKNNKRTGKNTWKIHLFMIITVTLKLHHWRIAKRDLITLHWQTRPSSITFSDNPIQRKTDQTIPTSIWEPCFRLTKADTDCRKKNENLATNYTKEKDNDEGKKAWSGEGSSSSFLRFGVTFASSFICYSS